MWARRFRYDQEGLPAAPAPGPSKDHDARLDDLLGAHEGATLLDTAETCNHTEPGHRILPALSYALRVPEHLGMSL